VRSLAVAARFSFFVFSRAAASSTSAFTMSLHFELHQLSRIAAGVARRAKFPFGVFERRSQRMERQISERIGAQEVANSFGRVPRGNQLVAPWRIDTVVAWR